MTDLTVRKPGFVFPEDLQLMPDRSDRFYSAFTCAITIIAPHIERYLIRTMSKVRTVIDDEMLKQDLLLFSQQEASHFQNHDRLNEVLYSKLSESGRKQLAAIEQALDADYQRFTREKSLNFNLVYAEGFESATCAMSLWAFRYQTFKALDKEWAELIEWHLAEEVEHRTVAYDAYHGYKGSYGHRMIFGTYAQYHLMKYLLRLGRCFLSEFNHKGNDRNILKSESLSLLKYLLNTLTPWYSPHKLEIDPAFKKVLNRYASEV